MGKSKGKKFTPNINNSNNNNNINNNNNNNNNHPPEPQVHAIITHTSNDVTSKSKKPLTEKQQLQYQQQLHQLQQQQIQQQKKILLLQQQVPLATINVDKHSIDQSFLSSNLDVLKSSQILVNGVPSSSSTSTASNHNSGNTTNDSSDEVPKQKTFMGDIPLSALYSFRFGNNEYYKERYKNAIDHYNTAISLSSSKNPIFLVVVLINRSITKLKLQEYKKSILDSTLAISIQPNCIKAYICRSFGYFFSKDFKKAFADHLIATNLAPHNFSLQRVMRYAHGSLFMYNADFFDHSLNNLSKIKSIQLEWLSDFNLLSIEEEPCRMHLLVKYMKDQIGKNKDNQQQQQQIINQQQQQQQQNSQQQNSQQQNSQQQSSQQQIQQQQNSLQQIQPQHQHQQQQQQQQNHRNTSTTPPSLIPSGEFTNGTSWSDLEEYYSLYKPTVSEQLASKQKLLGNADFQDKKYEAALGHYSKAIKLNPEDPIYYSNRGIVYYKLNRFYEAITDCSMSIDKQVKQFKAYLRRGSSFAAIGDYANAIRDFKAGLKYEPESIDLIDGLYKALKWIESDLKKKIQSNPLNSNTLELSLKSVSFELSFIAAKLNSKNTQFDQQHTLTNNNNNTTNSNANTPISSTNSPFLSIPQQNPNLINPPPSLSKNHQEKIEKEREKEKEKEKESVNKKQQQQKQQPSSSPSPQSSPSTTPTPSSPKTQPFNNKTLKKRLACYEPITNEQRNNLKSLISYLTELINGHVGDPSLILFSRAEAHAQLSDYPSASRDYEIAAHLNSKYTDIPKRHQRLKQIMKDHEQIILSQKTYQFE